VRVRIYKTEAGEPQETWPRFEALARYPGMAEVVPETIAYDAGGGKR
jgi:hypothetical protein